MIYKHIMANTSAVWQYDAHTTDQLLSPSLTKAIPKIPSLNQKHWIFLKNKSQEDGPVGTKREDRKSNGNRKKNKDRCEDLDNDKS